MKNGEAKNGKRLSPWVHAAWIHVMLACAVVALVGLISLLAGRSLIREMERVEAAGISRDVNRMRLEIQHEIWEIDTICRDWSSWKEMFAFAKDRNARFIEENLDDTSLHTVLDLDFLALFDDRARLVWGRAWPPEGEAVADVEALIRAGPGGHPLASSKTAAGPVLSGLRLTPYGPMLTTAHPVRDGRNEQTWGGTLVMGRFLHARRVSWLGQRTGLKVRFRDSRNQRFSPREEKMIREWNKEPFVTDAGELNAMIYLRIPDMTGEGFALVSIAWPRELAAQGRAAAGTVTISLFAAILLMLLTLGVILRAQSRQLERNRLELERQVKERTEELEESRQEALTLLDAANLHRQRLEKALAEMQAMAAALREGEAQSRALFENRRAPPEEGRFVLSESLFDFPRLLRRLEEEFGRRASAKRLILRFVLPAEIPQFLRADEAKIRHVIAGLLANAIRGTEAGSVAARVTVVSGDSPCRLAVEVADTGRGLSEESQERIFEPAEAADPETGADAGAEPEMAVCRRYARLMGGNLTLKSEPAHGSVFRFEFTAGVGI